jgi:ComF family protein
MFWVKDFINLIYPHHCAACYQTMPNADYCICLNCKMKLPQTDFHLERENTIHKLFWGKTNIQLAMSYLYFDKGNRVQNIIHSLKYKGNYRVGKELGVDYGIELKESGVLHDLDYIIPVPLHAKKQKLRGYNQAEVFGEGLSISLEKELLNAIYRRKHTSTQTKKSRLERWQNVDNIFGIEEPEKLINKHVLVVDDVITTGATIEACIQALLEIEGCRVSVATIACAR